MKDLAGFISALTGNGREVIKSFSSEQMAACEVAQQELDLRWKDGIVGGPSKQG
jgi:hypothetical protein